MVDLQTLFSRRGIEFRTDGPNCAKDHMVIKCPLCGSADPSEHMGIRLSDGAWGCWRDRTHRGRSIHRLLMLVLKISFAEARELAGSPQVNLDGFHDRVRAKLGRISSQEAPTAQAASTHLSLPPEFRPLSAASRFTEPHLGYLVERGFSSAHLDRLCRRYRLSYCLTGPFQRRVIFPIHSDVGLVGWTARAIDGRNPRYLASDPEAKRSLWNYDRAAQSGGGLLVVTEGPMDAMKIDFYASRSGVRAVALMGTAYLDVQLDLIRVLADSFDRVGLMFDRGVTSPAWRCMADLADIGPVRLAVPGNAEDPGAASEVDIKSMFSS